MPKEMQGREFTIWEPLKSSLYELVLAHGRGNAFITGMLLILAVADTIKYNLDAIVIHSVNEDHEAAFAILIVVP